MRDRTPLHFSLTFTKDWILQPRQVTLYDGCGNCWKKSRLRKSTNSTVGYFILLPAGPGLLTEAGLPEERPGCIDIDTLALWSSYVEQIIAKGTGEVLLTDYGYTGPAWKEAPGPGEKVDFFKNSIFYPEGFCLYRNFTVFNKDFVDKHPKLVVAYLKASQTATLALRQDTEQGRDLSWKYIKDIWKIPRHLCARIFADDLSMGVRHWIWMTYGDVKAITWSSEWAFANGIIPRNVTWEDVAPYFSKLSALEKQTWEELGGNPSIDEMSKDAETDLRGLPTWMMDKWPNKYP